MIERAASKNGCVVGLVAAAGWLGLAGVDASAQTPAPESEREGALLSGVRQLTFEGRRAGEGYFSADGQRMIFQSEREPGNPFFQIYLLDLETGDTQRISPGHGKTTCAWIHPSGKKVLYASTHDDPAARDKQKSELADREAGKQRRYAWDYDEFFDIYEYDLESGKTRALSNARGYDAEGSYSPDGKLIAFSSNRQAYDGTLPPEAKAVFEHDQSIANDIYIMNADGGGVKRLTDTLGYDGGPFFSPDGKRICWRRFGRDGATAEVFTMNIDGSDARQLTRLGAMSWAPFYHVSGEYLIFTTNVHGFGNFELYLVDAAGARQPVRVTYTNGFDGLPAFSPDGKRLAWTTSRGGGNQGQIFIADWNHEAALRLVRESPRATGDEAAKGEKTEPPAAAARQSSGSRGEAGQGAPSALPKTTVDVSPADVRAHVEVLASEAFEGRRTGTPGERLATQYVADCFARIGLEPAGDDGGFFQPFEFTAGVTVDAGNALRIERGGEAAALALDGDWRPLAFSRTGEIAPAEVAFVGYGVVAPAAEGQEAYDSYLDIDVKDKWVLVLRYLPERLAPERRQHLARHSSLRYKAMVARDRGACGIIVVSGPAAKVREQLVALESDAALAGTSLAAVSITDAAAEKLLAGSGQTLAARQAALDEGALRPGEVIQDVKVSADIRLGKRSETGRNVLGRLRAADEGARSRAAVVIGAHVDHLGRGGDNSLAREEEKGQIHPGADDNASGVAALLEIAEYFKSQQAAGALKLKRDIVFAAWSGEEIGLLGSAHFVAQAARGSAGEGKLGERFAAYLNMDMVGRLEKTLLIQGVGSSTQWAGEIEKRNAVAGLPISLGQDSYLPTDATSFYLQGVPVLSAFTGAHADYHRPTDTAEKLNYDGAAKVARLMGLLLRGVATSEAAPDYVKQDPPKSHGARAGLRAYLGSIPDYAEAPIPGVKLSGVASGGPAARAGLRGGDIIVELAGKKIENIYDYTYALDGLKVGEAVKIAVMRDGQRLTFEVMPGSRD